MPISYFNLSSSATPIFVSSSQRFIHRSVAWPDGDGTSLRVHCKQRFLSCTAFSVKEVVRVALCGVVGLFTPRFSWGVLTLSLPECLIEFCEVTLTFESVDEILWCDNSNERPQSAHGESHALKTIEFWQLEVICITSERMLSSWHSLGDKQIRDCLVPRHSRSLLWGYCPFTTPGHALRLSPAPRIEVQTPCVAQYYYGTLLMITGDYSSLAKRSLISQSINQSTSQSVHQPKNPPERSRRGKRACKLACINKRARDDDVRVVNRKCCEVCLKMAGYF